VSVVPISSFSREVFWQRAWQDELTGLANQAILPCLLNAPLPDLPNQTSHWYKGDGFITQKRERSDGL
jgi:hypothetical protein